MQLMNSNVYDALIDAGCEPEKAKKAAESVADDIYDIRSLIVSLDAKLDKKLTIIYVFLGLIATGMVKLVFFS